MTIPDRNARVRAAARPEVGPVVWEITRATFDSPELLALLLRGWEPFSVEGLLVYCRRQTLGAVN